MRKLVTEFEMEKALRAINPPVLIDEQGHVVGILDGINRDEKYWADRRAEARMEEEMGNTGYEDYRAG